MEPEWAMVRASIVEAATRSYDEKIIGPVLAATYLMETTGKGGHQAEEGDLLIADTSDQNEFPL